VKVLLLLPPVLVLLLHIIALPLRLRPAYTRILPMRLPRFSGAFNKFP
jgi:hypothetical protein